MQVFRRIAFLSLFLVLGKVALAQVPTPVDYVDPTIGGVGLILEPTRPLAHLPNSMVRVHPLKKDEMDDQLDGFPLTVASHRIGTVFNFLAFEQGAVEKPFTIHRQDAHPYAYSAVEEETYREIHFTPAHQGGIFKVINTSPKHTLRFSIMNASGSLQSDGQKSFSGHEDYHGMKLFFYAEIDGQIQQVEEGKKVLRAKVESKTKVLHLKYGISLISVEQAKINFNREVAGTTFEALQAEAKKKWNKELSKIQVKGWSEDKKKVFYTSIYRTLERMVDINEGGKYYSAFDKKVHQSSEPFFVDNWVWDSYIAHHPLNMLLNPEKDQAMIRSYIEMYKQTGWMPSFAVTFGDWPAMVGNHASAWMADAWSKGLRNFDVKTAYEGLKKNSLEATLLPWRNGARSELDDFYNANGYFPALQQGEKETVARVEPNWEKRQAVSVTLENSFSDWCIAQLASPANQDQDKALFLKRAQFYKNVYRDGQLWPKHKDGSWVEPYDPILAGREYFTENNAYTYTWHVKHDLPGLFGLMGGQEKAEQRLDALFRTDLPISKWKFWAVQPDASGLVGQFVMGNEPSLHIPYLYNYLGAPWKTQKRVRMLLDTWFTNNVFGMPGDEDGGGMSAWVVFSMMGFFQVTPGVPEYALASPSFSEIDMQLPNGKKFKIKADNNSDKNVYVQSASLNGKAMDKLFFTHEQLLQGGTLLLKMGDKPKL